MASHAEEADSESLCTNVLLQRRLGKCSKRACSVKGLTRGQRRRCVLDKSQEWLADCRWVDKGAGHRLSGRS